MLDIEKFVDGLHEYLRKEFTPIVQRLKALETRQTEKGEKGDKGDRGIDGKNIDEMELGKLFEKHVAIWALDFEHRASDILQKAIDKIPIPKNGIDGKSGLNGIDGKDGAPGYNGSDGIDGKNGVDGINGKDGTNGLNGTDGKDGLPGKSGADGKDGVNGRDGIDGKDGAPGSNGVNGKDGVDGKDGTNGKDGINGLAGKDGINGIDGRDGARGNDGINGKDGKDGINGIDGVNGKDGAPGKDGYNGKDGINGKDGSDGIDGKNITEEDIKKVIDQQVAVWALDFEKRASEILQKSIDRIKAPVDGANGSNGVDGKDGLGFDDLTIVQLNDKKLKFVFDSGERKKEFVVDMPIVIDQGVYHPGNGKEYTKGDGVTYGGSFWIAQKDHPNQTPGNGSEWRLAVKCGKDAKG